MAGSETPLVWRRFLRVRRRKGKLMQIGHREFTDGQIRAVHVDDEGKQYVFDNDGQPLYGVWIGPDTSDADPPIILRAGEPADGMG